MSTNSRSYGGGFTSRLRESFSTLQPSWLLRECGSPAAMIGFVNPTNPQDQCTISVDVVCGRCITELPHAAAQAELETYLSSVLNEVRAYERRYEP